MLTTIEVDEKKLETLRAIAKREGRSVEAVIDEVFQKRIDDAIDNEPMPHANDPIVIRARELFGTGSPELNDLLTQMTPDQALAVMDGIIDLGDANASADIAGQVRAHFRKKYGNTD